MEGSSELVEDDSAVKEVAPVKPKRKYAKRRQPLKKSDKEFVELWTTEEDVDVQEVAPMGRDRAKKKSSISGARSETSIAGDPILVNALLSKFTMTAKLFFRRE
nr:hypothetical protein [Tanacetum cinerariifolium]